MLYDVIIPLKQEHIKQLTINLDFIVKNLSVNKVKIICKKDSFKDFKNFKYKEALELLDEDNIYFFNKRDIEEIITGRNGRIKRSGWYFQQFLKMAYCFICENDYYLIWDADTIPLKKLSFFSEDKKRMLFNRKTEHHIPYFETLDLLFDKKLKYQQKSFISEGMIVDCKIMKELILTIDRNSNLKGNNWVEKIMYSIPDRDLSYSGFSEFETYGNYLINKYPDKYQERPLKTLRNGMSRYGRILTEAELLTLDFDTISFEDWDKKNTFFHKLASNLWKLYNNLIYRSK